ncbi:carbohydrate ABC transporter permease [Actinocatenispora rupis]|uniref:ABC transporter permease n=1 Tax=Actinocatenispora rupis TaxID=519421 RepID=A0A8J3NBK5_9ACTN|nr:sugar ABC transporter permease [Actinocatenispora rupis]GID09449.1 ABC transporter permease [Actinocatenispora rupis]
MAVDARTATRRDTAQAGAPRRRRRIQWVGYLYILPALAVLTVFLLVPLGQCVQISLYHWDGLSPATWAGVANYVDLARDPVLRSGFGHTLVLVVGFAVLPILFALTLVAVMGRAVKLRGLSVYRVVLFLPQVIASVVVATSWVAIYAPDGVLNGFLALIGLKMVTRPWLGDFGTALPAVGLIGTWVEIGLCLVLFLAGVAQIPRELYEAARLDGAGIVREFFAVTLPGLRGQIAVALTLTVIAAFKTFDLVYVTTHGGPGTSTVVPAYLIYDRAFNLSQVGSACAVGVVLTAVILVITLVINRVSGGGE